MNKQTKRLMALMIYVLLVFLPLIIFLLFPMPAGRSFWRDFSVMLGFVGLSLAGLQLLPTARISFISEAFKMDDTYRAHHWLSLLSILLVLLHPIILLINNPNTLLLLNPLTTTWTIRAGMLGLTSLILIAITSVLRKDLHIDYNAWHGVHDILALIIAVAALIHLTRVDHYMSAPAMRLAWLIEVLIWVGATVYVRVLKPLDMQRHSYVVQEVITELPDTWTVVLKPQGHAGMRFEAGQVAWLNINSSPFTLHRNPFSFAGSAHRESELRFSIKDAGDFTSAVGKLKGGETVYVDGPYGSFSLADPQTKTGLVLMAGGIGVAPVMSILYTLADEKDQRPIYLFYGNRNENEIAFLKEIEVLQKQLNLSVTQVLEVPSTRVKSENGFITHALLERELPANRADLHYFICGPLPMIAAMEKNLRALKIPRSQVTYEKYEMA
jgi:predicted ferric reductase